MTEVIRLPKTMPTAERRNQGGGLIFKGSGFQAFRLMDFLFGHGFIGKGREGVKRLQAAEEYTELLVICEEMSGKPTQLNWEKFLLGMGKLPSFEGGVKKELWLRGKKDKLADLREAIKLKSYHGTSSLRVLEEVLSHKRKTMPQVEEVVKIPRRSGTAILCSALDVIAEELWG